MCVCIWKGGKKKEKLLNILGRKSICVVLKQEVIVPLVSVIKEGWYDCSEVRNGAVTRTGSRYEIMQGLVEHFMESGHHYKRSLDFQLLGLHDQIYHFPKIAIPTMWREDEGYE